MADTRLMFVGGKCVACGHLQGDHEKFPSEDVWTCDDDGCNDRLDYCTTKQAGRSTEAGEQRG